MDDADAATKILIAQLLESDFHLAIQASQAESLQVSQILTDSNKHGLSRRQRRRMQSPVISDAPVPLPDDALALQLLSAEARTSSDAAFAQGLQQSEDASLIASRQYALKVAAEEKKFALDAEFAKKLHEVDEAGEEDLDSPQMKDADQ